MQVVQRSVSFEGFTLDLARGSLRCGERIVELRPKSFEVLRHLVENAGRLVSKDELVHAVWADIAVTDDALTHCVSEIRAALGTGGPRLIKTVPRRGYLFDAPVADDAMPTAGRAEGLAAPGRRRPKVWALIGAAALALAVATVLLWPRSGAPPLPDRPSIAVLPFSNLGDPQQDYFSDGIADDLITGLAKFSGLTVIARNSAFAYKGKSVDERRIGRDLGARYLLEGSLRREGERLRVTAQLVDSQSDRPLWAQSYDREVKDVLAVQDEVTQKIVTTLVAHVTRAELDRALRKPPGSLVAYDYYLRGNAESQLMGEGGRYERLAAARGFYEQALAADPNYAPALQALASIYVYAWLEPEAGLAAGEEHGQKATLDRALVLAQRAVEIDPQLPEAHATLAFVLEWQYRRDEALAEFERARQLNPNLADGRYSPILYQNGRPEDAIDFILRAKRLDPFHPALYARWLGTAYYLVGDYTQALEMLRISAVREPDHRPAQVWLAAAAAQTDHMDEARQAAAAVLRIDPGFSIHKWLDFIRLARPRDATHLADGLRRAGLPD